MKDSCIELSNGMKTLVDSEELERLSEFKWGYGYGASYKRGYQLYVGANKKGGGTLLLHRFIMNTPKGFHTDHINGDHLDNRKCNLRICTPAQNQFNSRKHKSGSSSYKGVSFYTRDKCWRAYLATKGRQYHLGYFSTEVQAAMAYNLNAEELFGTHAFLNKI